MQRYWFFALMASICFEGLGRKYIPGIPAFALYLLKDVVLLSGFALFPRDPALNRISEWLFRGFGVFWIGAFIWTLIEVANPSQPSIPLALIGLRAYWLWFAAPLVIARALQDANARRRAIYALAFITIAISALAALQFVSPPDSVVNLYSVVDGEELYAAQGGMVSATGRARVCGTFAFLSGFVDFTILVPTLLLSIGIDASDARVRRIAFVATGCASAVLPMSGSRSSVVLGLGVLALTCWSAGLFLTSVGRRILIGGALGMVLAVAAFPDAFVGVQSRFAAVEETQSRIVAVATNLPPVALLALDYPAGGMGTGVAQNAASSFGVSAEYPTELEMHRYLVELGVVGFLLVWCVRLGLMLAMVRAYKILNSAERRGAAAAALSYAGLTFFGNLTFDHIWQALYFVGAGIILAETKSALELLKAKAQQNVAAVGPAPISVRV